MSKNNIFRFIAAFILCQAAGAVGSIFTSSAMASWYAFLNKPAWSPPNWLFAPVWLTLYTLMAIALFLVWREGFVKREVIFAFIFFIIHLFFNAVWSILFFGLHSPLAGMLDIAILWGMIAILLLRFSVINRSAAWFLVPYFLWVSFASILNLSIVTLNL